MYTVVFSVLHNATPKFREEDSGTPDQKNLVILGKSVSVGEKGLVVVPALETQGKTKAQQRVTMKPAETQTHR